MKKIVSILTILIIFSVLVFNTQTFAASLDTIDIQPTKTIVRPGEEVSLNVSFGKGLASYTANVFYDNNLFDYVSTQGGEGNNTGNKIIVSFYDNTGGANPSSSMSVKFKAKSNITTSNSTGLNITLEGLASIESGARVEYSDITTPIVNTVTVEPEYVDYTLKLQYTGEIVKEKEIPMTLSYSSEMGRYYDHARLIADATTPEGASVRLLAIDNARLEHDIIDSGWGDEQGFSIGGKNVSQVLQTRAIFSKEGDYTITLKLIDRDSSDNVIAQTTIPFKVLEKETTPTNDNDEQPTSPEEPQEDIKTPAKPTKLPKTGKNIYISSIGILTILMGAYLYYNKRK